MWRLSSTLQTLGNGRRLPAGFRAARGIRSLFPSRWPNELSLSLLQNYVYSQTGWVILEAVKVDLFVAAAGAGNWILQGAMKAGTEPRG
jgi:hypothetical protein